MAGVFPYFRQSVFKTCPIALRQELAAFFPELLTPEMRDLMGLTNPVNEAVLINEGETGGVEGIEENADLGESPLLVWKKRVPSVVGLAPEMPISAVSRCGLCYLVRYGCAGEQTRRRRRAMTTTTMTTMTSPSARSRRRRTCRRRCLTMRSRWRPMRCGSWCTRRRVPHRADCWSLSDGLSPSRRGVFAVCVAGAGTGD